MKKLQQPGSPLGADDPNWRNLRDEQGVLYGRVNRVQMLLELRRNQKTVTFNLDELLNTGQTDQKTVK
jgi:hypothetical protein